MASNDNPLALLILIHAKSNGKRDKLMALHNSYNWFFHDLSTQTSTKSMFTPSTRPKANLGMVPEGENSTLLGLFEIWSSKAAFEAVQQKPKYKAFHSTVVKEDLFDHKSGMEISEWTPAAGFVARKGEKETPKAEIVMLAKFVLKQKDVDANRDGLVGVLG